MKYYLAIDLGATSGRHIVAHQEKGEIVLEEIHRFPTGMKESKDGLIWDIDTLYQEILIGIKKSIQKYKVIESLAIDTWGVDYVLLNNDKIIYPCIAYRNEANDIAAKKVHDIIPFENLYKLTGIQFAPFNTVYQLFRDNGNKKLDNATDYLMMPEFFSYLLTGKKVHEYTNASTTGLLNLKTGDFDSDIIQKLDLPKKLFTKMVMPGTYIGNLKDDVIKQVGGDIKVLTAPSHDTASAFEAIETPNDAVIVSSGTWSLVGVKLEKGNNSSKSFASNFTNEGGVGYIRYLKNIMGMWLINSLSNEYGISVPDLVELAKTSSFEENFDVNDKSLYAPKCMDIAIKTLLKNNNLSKADIANSTLISLAYSYKKVADELEDNLGIKFNSFYIIGGGAKNKYLNGLVEKISGRKVVALPIEATTIGNIKTQIKGDK